MRSLSLKQLLTRSGGLLASRMVGAGIALFTNILIARYFGAEALGMFALVLAVAALVAIVLPLGFQAVAVLFVSRYTERGRPDLIAGFVLNAYFNLAVVTGTAVAVLAALTMFVPAFGASAYAVPAWFAVGMAPAVALINLNCFILNGLRRPFAGLLPDLLYKPALMLSAVLVCIATIGTTSVHMLLGAVCLALWASALFHVPQILRLGFGKASRPGDEAAEWRKAAWPWMAITAMSDYFIEMHLLLAGALAAPAQIAVLHVCFRLRMLAAYGVRAFYALLLPDIYASYERFDLKAFRSGILRANFLVLGYGIAVCALIVPLGGWVLGFFGDEFAHGTNVLLIVCLSMIARAVFGPAPAIMAMTGQHSQMVWILSGGTGAALVFGTLMYSRLGLEAFAVSFTVSYSLIAMAQWWWVRRETGIDCSIFTGLVAPDEATVAQHQDT